MRRAAVLTVLVALAVSVLVGACGSDAGSDGSEPPGDGGVSGPVAVFAASSLTEVYDELATAFEAAHHGVDVQLQYGASTALARQVADGAPADVLATADRPSIDSVQAEVESPTVFARNRLAIIVERGNPKAISSLADLARHDLKTVVCAPEVPCGRLADAALQRAGVELSPASREQNVKAVVSKVTLGEADAGIVYATDVRAAGDSVEGVVIEGSGDTDLQAVYLAAPVTRSKHLVTARAWVSFLTSPTAQKVLTDAGFELP